MGSLDEKLGCASYSSIILVFLFLLPPGSGYVDCRISCRRCHENTEIPSVVEVYCAMCEECKQRRRERLQDRETMSTAGRTSELDDIDPMPHQVTPYLPLAAIKKISQLEHKLKEQQEVAMKTLQRQLDQYQHESQPTQATGWPAGCPTPPVCSDSDEDNQYLSANAFGGGAPTAPATTASSCPPVYPCKKKASMYLQPYCMPCMPMCPCPSGQGPAPSTPVVNARFISHEDGTVSTTQTPETEGFDYVYVGLPKGILR